MPTAAPPIARHRRSRTAALAAALALCALSIGSPAVAAPGPRPADNSGLVLAPVAPVVASLMVSTRAALEALPNRADLHVDQIMKNLAIGAMG